MKTPHHPRIRILLRDNIEGMTSYEIACELGINYKTVRKVLESMPDVYIDRWALMPGSRGQFSAVWNIVVPPRNCPHPTGRTNAEIRTTWNHRHTNI